MNLPVYYSEKAVADIQKAFDWYEVNQSGLGERFLRSLEDVEKTISSFPLAYPQKYKKTREVFVEPFPFLLIYRVQQDAVWVLAVFPARKNPRKKYSV